MSQKLSKVRIVKTNNQVVLGRRDASVKDLQSWFVKSEREEVFDVKVLSITDKPSSKEKTTWAQVIENEDFEPSELPIFLH